MKQFFTKDYWTGLWEGIKAKNPKHPKLAAIGYAVGQIGQLALITLGVIYTAKLVKGKFFSGNAQELPNLTVMDSMKRKAS